MTKIQTSYPSYGEAREAAGLPVRVTAEQLIDRDIVVQKWEPATATLPGTGEVTEGFLVTLLDVAKDETQEFFCGQKVLVKELHALKPPFSTVIRRDGRAYLFS